jgi:hypothetical protein
MMKRNLMTRMTLAVVAARRNALPTLVALFVGFW